MTFFGSLNDMLVLAFDTSSKTVSVSLLRDQVVIYETIVNRDINHSETLLAAIDEACRLSALKIREVDLLACTTGPGSFTGLRIGVSTLKGLMLATGKPAAGVSSLAALALNIETKGKIIGAMMDAGRGQVYLAYYQYETDGTLRQLTEAKALDPNDLADQHLSNVIYVGDGAVQYDAVIRNLLKNDDVIAPERQKFICASAVGKLAIQKFQSNDLLDLKTCVPVYLRSADVLPQKSIYCSNL